MVLRYINRLNRRLEEAKKSEMAEKLTRLTNVKKGIFKKDSDNSKEEIAEEAVEPETKLCPYCLSEIPYKATRCGHCTSTLED